MDSRERPPSGSRLELLLSQIKSVNTGHDTPPPFFEMKQAIIVIMDYMSILKRQKHSPQTIEIVLKLQRTT